MLRPSRTRLAASAAALAAGLAALTLARAPAVPAADPPPGPRYVPADAALFVHAEVAKLWNGPIGKSVQKADPKMVADLFAQAKALTGITPDQLTAITAFWPKLKGPRDMQSFGLVLGFAQPYDAVKLKAGLGKLLAEHQQDRMTLITPDPKTAVALFGLGDDYAQPRPAGEAGPLATALKEAAGDRVVVVAANLENMPDEIRGDDLPPDFAPFAPILKADTVAGLVGVGKDVSVEVRVKAATPALAGDAEKAMGLLATLARQTLAAGKTELAKEPGLKDLLALLTAADGAFETAKFTTTGAETRTVLTMPADLPFGTAFVDGVRKVRGAAARARSTNNLKQIALALHGYHDTYGTFPPAAVVDKAGKPLLSWRVLVLPYIEQDNLYKQFKLDEPWDSDHNKKLLAPMPNVYQLPTDGEQDKKETKTHYRVFTGNGAAFDLLTGVKITDFQDGTSNTILVATAADGVPWTKPDELAFDTEADPTKLLGPAAADTFVVAFADGSVRSLKKTIKPQTLGHLITRSGGEVVNPDDF